MEEIKKYPKLVKFILSYFNFRSPFSFFAMGNYILVDKM